ncbi:MAG: hypothetical protein ACTHQE_07560 [Thermomicrobiales bacterium]
MQGKAAGAIWRTLIGPMLVAEDIPVEVAFRTEPTIVADMAVGTGDRPVEAGRVPVASDHMAHHERLGRPDVLFTAFGRYRQQRRLASRVTGEGHHRRALWHRQQALFAHRRHGRNRPGAAAQGILEQIDRSLSTIRVGHRMLVAVGVAPRRLVRPNLREQVLMVEPKPARGRGEIIARRAMGVGDGGEVLEEPNGSFLEVWLLLIPPGTTGVRGTAKTQGDEPGANRGTRAAKQLATRAVPGECLGHGVKPIGMHAGHLTGGSW